MLLKGQDDVGETVQRDGAHDDDARHPVQLQLQRQRDQALNLFGRVAGPLRDQFDLRRGEIGIGVHGHAPEGDDSGDHHEEGEHQHQEALTKRRLYDSMDHSGVDSLLILIVRFSVQCFYRCSELANCRNKLPSPITRSPDLRSLQ